MAIVVYGKLKPDGPIPLWSAVDLDYWGRVFRTEWVPATGPLVPNQVSLTRVRIVKGSGIWRLHLEADKYRCFVPHDLQFFAKRFECEPLQGSWEVPPAKILGKSKPAKDFVSWMNRAPVVSQRTQGLVHDLAGEDVEFLPFHELDGKPYFAMNVLRCEDYLDREGSDLTHFVRERFVFQRDLPEGIPPIFKCPGQWDCIFVTSAFGELMVAHKLRGAALADPAEPLMPLILAKRSANRYPGLIP